MHITAPFQRNMGNGSSWRETSESIWQYLLHIYNWVHFKDVLYSYDLVYPCILSLDTLSPKEISTYWTIIIFILTLHSNISSHFPPPPPSYASQLGGLCISSGGRWRVHVNIHVIQSELTRWRGGGGWGGGGDGRGGGNRVRQRSCSAAAARSICRGADTAANTLHDQIETIQAGASRCYRGNVTYVGGGERKNERCVKIKKFLTGQLY